MNSNNDLASSYIIGTTIQNRQLKVIKLKAPNASNQAIWIGISIYKIIYIRFNQSSHFNLKIVVYML